MPKTFARYGLEASGATHVEARQALEAMVTHAVDTRFEQGVIVCVDGTLLITTGGLTEGTYVMHREGGRAGSVSLPNLQFMATARAMASHAWGSYGGVRWSSGIPTGVMGDGQSDAHQGELDRARFWLEAARTGAHPGIERDVVLREAARYAHLSSLMVVG